MRHRFMLVLLVLPVLAGGLLAAAGGCSHPAGIAEAPAAEAAPAAALDRVTAGKPERKNLERSTTQPGRISAFEQSPLYARLEGYVDAVLVDIGDPVRKGQVLLRLAIPELSDELAQKEALVAQAEAEVQQAAAALRAAQAAVTTAHSRIAQAEAGVERAAANQERWKAEHARINELAARGSVTQKLAEETLDQFRSAEAAMREAQAGVQVAAAAVQEAEAAVQQAEADQQTAAARHRVAQADAARARTMLGYTEVKAPFDGVVTARGADSGHYARPAASTPLLVVASQDTVRVAVDIPEMEAALVDGGDAADPAIVRIPALGDREFSSKVARTTWSLQESNRSLRSEIHLPNPEGLLRPGMFASVTILLARRENVLTLPLSAVVWDGQQPYCCCVVNGRIERRPIELGLRSGGEVELVSGVGPDDLVVLSRAESLQPGQQVAVLNRPASPR